MKTSKKALLMAAALAAGVAAPAAAETPWSLGTSSTGSGPYVNGVVVAKAVNGSQDAIEVSPQTTGGFNENLGLVAAGSIDMGMTSSLDLNAAYQGEGKFADVQGKEIFKNLRVAFVFSGNACHFLTRADSDIKSFDDIKGRNINLNAPSTFTRGFNESILKALGISTDDFNVFSISTGKHFDALQDGVIDMGMHCYPVGHNAILKLTATTPVHLLSLPDDAFDRLNEAYGGVLNKLEIPAGTYDGQTEAATTVFNTDALFVNKDASEDDVYAFTKAYWENLEAMQQESPGFRGITPAIGAFKGAIPMHPGAARYFKEIGVM